MRNEHIVLMDGAVGTSLWAKTDNKVDVWRYNLENPAIVQELVNEYIEAGSQMVFTNTFGANRYAVKRQGFEVEQIVPEGVRLVKEAAAGRAKVVMSAGPLPFLMEPYGDLTEEQTYEAYDEMFAAGVPQGPDGILLQTFMDADMLHIAAKAAMKYGLPIYAMMTFTEVGKTMMGHSVEYFVDVMRDVPLAGIGLNCSLGPEKAVPVIRSFRDYTDLPLMFKPNAGKPILQEGVQTVQYDIPTFVEDCMPALECGVRYIGGCCGSDPGYIRALRDRIFGKN